MNLYLFNDDDTAAVYGIGTYLKELTNALKETDINVHIVHLRSDKRKFEIIKINQVENWYIPEVRYNNRSIGNVQEKEDYFRNVVFLLKLNIKDIKDLIFHFNYNHCQILVKELKEAFICKTVSTIHFLNWQLLLHSNLNSLYTLKKKSKKQRNFHEQNVFFTYEYENLLFKEVDRLIVLSENTQHILETEYQLDSSKISVVYNGLNNINQMDINVNEMLRKKWFISREEFVILFVGRLTSVKGLIFLIKAFRELLAVLPNCHLIIAGNGDFDTHLNEAKDICTKITFTGLLEKKKIYELYQIADIGVMPSFHEQCSYVAIEMMMHSVPIIGSTSTGLKEMIVDGETGLHIPVIEYDNKVEIDSSLLSEKMLHLLQNPEELKRMGINSRQLYTKKYSLSVFRKNMLNFYHSK